MRLNNLSDNIIFDEFEEMHHANHKIFLSSMLNIESLIISKYFPAKIYTSDKIVNQMLTYCHQKDINLKRNDFIKLVPNEATKIQLDDGECLEVIMFETEDVNNNVMFMFKKDNRTTHVYAGICTEFRSLILNDVFAKWIKYGVENLYVDVSHAQCDDEIDPRNLNNTLDSIENLLESHPDYLLLMNVPKFGYERLVYYLSKRLRSRVSIGGIMAAVFKILDKSQYFVSNYKDAKILIVNKCFTMEAIKSGYETRKYIFIKIITKSMTDSNKHTTQPGLYEFNWSPLPTAFDLKLLASILHPDRIYAIHHNSIDQDIVPEVPRYLHKLCNEYSQIEKRIERENDYEAHHIEESISLVSSNEFSNESTQDTLMKLTQEEISADNFKKVQQWLTSEDKISKPENRTLKSKSKQNSINANVKNNKDPPNSFCIQKRCLKYLEDSDSS